MHHQFARHPVPATAHDRLRSWNDAGHCPPLGLVVYRTQAVLSQAVSQHNIGVVVRVIGPHVPVPVALAINV